VGLCRHCRVLRASTAAGLRAGAVARSRAARQTTTHSPGVGLHATSHKGRLLCSEKINFAQILPTSELELDEEGTRKLSDIPTLPLAKPAHTLYLSV